MRSRIDSLGSGKRFGLLDCVFGVLMATRFKVAVWNRVSLEMR